MTWVPAKIEHKSIDMVVCGGQEGPGPVGEYQSGMKRAEDLMKLSTRARYGMRAILDLAINGDSGLVLLKDIAARQEISKRYLEHIMTLLRNGGLVVAERGARGGYRLARSPEDIRLDEIVEALEGTITPVSCVGDPSVCEKADECIAREIWGEVACAMRDTLKAKTLEDLKLKWESARPPEETE